MLLLDAFVTYANFHGILSELCFYDYSRTGLCVGMSSALRSTSKYGSFMIEVEIGRVIW